MARSKVNIGRALVEGRYRYRVNYFRDGKRKRMVCDSKKQAEAEASRIRQEIATTGEAWNDLPANERSRLMDVWSAAKEQGIDLQAILIERKLNPTLPKRIKLEDAITALVKSKTDSGKSPDYTDNLSLVLSGFAKGREATFIDAITTADVEAFLNTKSVAYRSTLRARLSTLFRYCLKRSYCQRNPCDSLESVSYAKPPPQIFTPDQLKSALDWLKENPRGAAWFILTTLCGLRPEEAQKTAPEKLHFQTGAIVVDAQTTKVRQRRIVTPLKPVMKLLKLSVEKWKSELPLTKQVRRRVTRRLRKLLGLDKWPKDITRHTAASYWLAIKPDAAYVAEQLGNSERILKRDYKVPIAPDTVKQYTQVIKQAGADA